MRGGRVVGDVAMISWMNDTLAWAIIIVFGLGTFAAITWALGWHVLIFFGIVAMSLLLALAIVQVAT